jgi:DNA helicase-2/ATP-dependent DNA helicase PcrA
MGSRPRKSMSAASVYRSSSTLRDASGMDTGQAVQHPFFGRGIIDKVTGERTVEVVFDRHGRKTLHLDYAKLKKIE